MKRVNNKCMLILGIAIGITLSVTSVYAVDAYIESNKVTYNNHNKENVQEAIDELYEKSGIHKNKWIDPILNGADPVLKDPLIPVTIDNDGNVYYANLNSEWYNYSEKRWANAVILIDNSSNPNYEVGDHILESDIESYFVWIPRYQYKVWNLGQYTTAVDSSTLNNANYATSLDNAINGPRLIDIRFGTYETYPKMTEPNTTGVYYTHPAFTLGTKNLNGMWVGKFETGYKGATNTTTSRGDVTDPDKVIIKPDAYAWRYITAKNIFMTSYNYERGLDSHMMKNTEWGAVAYLSHSQYGIGAKVRVNNTSDYKTGYSSAVNTDQSVRRGIQSLSTDSTNTQLWNTLTGYLASTTGNISGIYDMSGGAWELVAACMEGTPGSTSGFDASTLATEMAKGYIDKYNKSSTTLTYNYRILGDATGELGPFYKFYYKDGGNYNFANSSWYTEVGGFAYTYEPWFGRGGLTRSGGVPGIFDFGKASGAGYNESTFRITLAPN